MIKRGSPHFRKKKHVENCVPRRVQFHLICLGEKMARTIGAVSLCRCVPIYGGCNHGSFRPGKFFWAPTRIPMTVLPWDLGGALFPPRKGWNVTLGPHPDQPRLWVASASDNVLALVFSLTFTGNHILLGFLADGHDFPMTLNMSSSSSSSNPACPSPAAFRGLFGDVNYCIVCSLRRPNSHLMSTRLSQKIPVTHFNPWVSCGLSEQKGG